MEELEHESTSWTLNKYQGKHYNLPIFLGGVVYEENTRKYNIIYSLSPFVKQTFNTFY